MDNKEYMKKYHKENRGKQLASFKEYYGKNRTSILKQKRDTYGLTGKRRYFKKRYGLTLEQVDSMIKEQNNVCAICGKDMIGKSNRHLDHDHVTGKVRELLCHNCNRGLGFLKDDVGILQSAIHYLNKWREINRVCQSGYSEKIS